MAFLLKALVDTTLLAIQHWKAIDYKIMGVICLFSKNGKDAKYDPKIFYEFADSSDYYLTSLGSNQGRGCLKTMI